MSGQVVGGPRKSALEIVVGPGVEAGKPGAGQLERGLDLLRRNALREHPPGNPQIDNAPVRIGKPLSDSQLFQPRLVNGTGMACVGGAGRVGGSRQPGEGGRGSNQAGGGLHQAGPSGGQLRTGVAEPDPGWKSGGQAALRFGVGESGEPAHMEPVGAGRIAVVQVGQVARDLGGHGGGEGVWANSHPGLESAGAGFGDHAGLVSAGAHVRNDAGPRRVQVQQDVAGVVGERAGLEEHVVALPVGRAEEADDSGTAKLGA